MSLKNSQVIINDYYINNVDHYNIYKNLEKKIKRQK